MSGTYGTNEDILISYDSGYKNWNYGHAAIVRKGDRQIIEAWPGDGVRLYTNNWSTRWNSKKKMYVRGASSSNYTNAQAYAYDKLGSSYNLLAGKQATSMYYCSLLVWQAWNKQGYDLDGNGGSIVTPADLESSSRTQVY